MPPSPQSRRWVFTLNNPTEDDEQRLGDLFGDQQLFTYAVYGRETGESGTPHLQGFFVLTAPKRRTWCSGNVSARAHFEVARGTSAQASDYCKKDGVFDEFGTLPADGGRRTDLERFQEWVANLSHRPSDRDICAAFPGLWIKYPRLTAAVDHLLPPPNLTGVNPPPLRPWQQELADIIAEEADDRKIHFFVDPDGAAGKSWMCRHLITEHPQAVQVLSIGKRDDLALCIDETKSIFLFDIPRDSMEFLQYTILEKLKDRMIFSAKYASRMKFLLTNPHVVVFCNEPPDMAKLTMDRYDIHDI